jgi:hypothetical protein
MPTAQRPQLPPGVIEALKQGNKIEAIRILRESTKMGLTEAKAAVEMLDKMKGVVGAAQAIANVAQSVRPAATSNTSSVSKNVRMHAKPGPAPLRRPGMSPGEMPRDGNGVVGIAILVIVGLALALSLVR